ncbi:WD repeat protein, putative [Trichomonas vaginalis G3]|uniref:WD repeat protein, putative n=1 Tax=Trichomonas vaginalis (strain ATCC PRA-98 / G3) TaxID=412133 RepID=A2EAC7_TRIV3|nr:U4 snRNA binding [Trichomonas vaginalis G3]EAY10354.1 WD repeat protein, putative [Trichomonas vaginalis G3]KAI5485363.1 U4 snRNA binding [Trichomonas vaginalis G3]|eukprot:XP_001322577.1 WD repeat protein [Trichomonas vaginalis G3]
MDHAVDGGSYILEEVELEVDDSSDGEYVNVQVEDLPEENEKSEDEENNQPMPQVPQDNQPVVVKYNEVVDDFVRNFLKKMNMTETLATFQHEWYSTERPNLFCDLTEEIADIKQKTEQMEQERKKWQTVRDEVQQTWDRLKQERNYHRDGLEALEKEKKDLTEDLRKMKKTRKRLDPALAELQQKFEQVNKERSLLRIERDRLMAEIQKLQKDGGDAQQNKD